MWAGRLKGRMVIQGICLLCGRNVYLIFLLVFMEKVTLVLMWDENDVFFLCGECVFFLCKSFEEKFMKIVVEL